MQTSTAATGRTAAKPTEPSRLITFQSVAPAVQVEKKQASAAAQIDGVGGYVSKYIHELQNQQEAQWAKEQHIEALQQKRLERQLERVEADNNQLLTHRLVECLCPVI